MTNAHVKHPILHLEVVAPDGTREPDHVVFCLLHRQFVRVEDCCQCVHYAFIGEGLPPSVDCSPLPPSHGERTDVGSLLSRGTVVVADTVSLGRALDQLRTSGRHSLAIVDEVHVMIGVVHEAGLVGRTAPVRPRAVWDTHASKSGKRDRWHAAVRSTVAATGQPSRLA